MAVPVEEFPPVNVAIGPGVHSKSVWQSLLISPSVVIFIGELLKTLPVFQRLEKLPFVAISIHPKMHPDSMWQSFLPLADILVSLNSIPNARSVF
jgi:hypothetical protein